MQPRPTDLYQNPLAPAPAERDIRRMWDAPYLETCCRAALHRLQLSGENGRPPDLKDRRCLQRLETLGFATHRPDDRTIITEAGVARHAQEILRQPTKPPDEPPG